MRKGLHVRRGEAELTPALGTPHHDALDAVRTAEDLRGPRDVALGDQAAGERRGERLAAARFAADVEVDDLGAVVVRRTEFGEERDVAGRAVPEPEVGAFDDQLRVELVDEDLHDEVGGRELRERSGERQDQHRVHPEPGHQLGTALVRCEQRRVRAGADDLAGVRVEGDDDRGDAELPRPLHGTADDQLVSAVHPVVGPDGDDAASPVLRDVLQATPAVHSDRSSPEPVYVCVSITQV
ncbi:hypothetical protein RKD45_005081 [Streptomyces griseus]